MINAFRKIGTVKDAKDDPKKGLDSVKKVFVDIQSNFDLIAQQVPRLSITPPSPGEIRFLVLESDGTWAEWALVADSGITFVQDDVNKTLTIVSP